MTETMAANQATPDMPRHTGDPHGWQTLSIRRLFRIVGGATPKSEVAEYWDGDVQWVTPADLGKTPSLEVHKSARTLTRAGLDSCAAELLPPGSIIVSVRAPIGAIGIAKVPMATNQGCKALVGQSADYKFMAYQLSVGQASLEAIGRGTTFTELSATDLGSFQVIFPPLDVQKTIAAFLDRETAKIDALIVKQEQLIVTLREDRAATITEAVTKGLDPNTRMKASGVQWISEIPETWNVLRLSWMFATISSGTTPDSKNLNYYGGEINWVTTGELREGCVEKTTSRVTDLALADHSALRIYEPGSLVIAMYGATIGRLRILSAPACTNQACCVFSKPKQTDVRFIYYVLQAAREHLLVLASGGGQPNINQDKLRALRVPAPSFDTQRKISEYLDERCSKIDALIVKSTETIKVLREYRSVLITNAVTGKIDVREAV